MAKLKKARVNSNICPTCKGNGYVRVATDGDPVNFRDTSDTNVGTVIRRENTMRQLMMGY